MAWLFFNLWPFTQMKIIYSSKCPLWHLNVAKIRRYNLISVIPDLTTESSVAFQPLAAQIDVRSANVEFTGFEPLILRFQNNLSTNCATGQFPRMGFEWLIYSVLSNGYSCHKQPLWCYKQLLCQLCYNSYRCVDCDLNHGHLSHCQCLAITLFPQLYVSVLTSVTRIGENSPLWYRFINLWQFLTVLFSIWQNWEPTLVNFMLLGKYSLL